MERMWSTHPSACFQPRFQHDSTGISSRLHDARAITSILGMPINNNTPKAHVADTPRLVVPRIPRLPGAMTDAGLRSATSHCLIPAARA